MRWIANLLEKSDLSARGRARVYLLTCLGTLLCIAVAFVFDSYSPAEGWRWGENPLNNVIIPLVLAPPLLFLLLSKLRELAIAHQELLVISATDSLTSCYNRRAFTALVDGYLEKLDARGKEGGLLLIDVDHFKGVNDTYGHDSGDEALKLIADAIKGAVRDTDLIGRLGGEEFSVFLPSTPPGQMRLVAERIRLSINMLEFAPTVDPIPLSVSVGGTAFRSKTTFNDLYRRADKLLYDAKRKGRDRVEIDMAPYDTAPAAMAG